MKEDRETLIKTLFEAILLKEDQQAIFNLVDELGDPNVADPAGDTPLHYAVKLGWVSLARKLIDVGADIEAENSSKKTPLQLAEESKNKEMIQLLRQASEQKQNFGDLVGLPLELLARISKNLSLQDQKNLSCVNKELLRNIRSKNTKWGVALLNKLCEKSVEEKDFEKAVELVEQGADPNITIYLLGGDNTPLLYYVMNFGTVNLVDRLISSGAKINAAYKNRETPLHWAARSGNTEIAKLLIEKGVNLTAVNNKGRTALQYAKQNKHTELAALLENAMAPTPRTRRR